MALRPPFIKCPFVINFSKTFSIGPSSTWCTPNLLAHPLYSTSPAGYNLRGSFFSSHQPDCSFNWLQWIAPGSFLLRANGQQNWNYRSFFTPSHPCFGCHVPH